MSLLQVAQPGDRQWGEMTLDKVRLSSCGTSRSTWKLLVCKGQQKMETVWLSVVRAWGMPVSKISAEAAIWLGHAAQPNEWSHVRPCSDTGWLGGAFPAKIASTLEVMPSDGTMATRPREKDYRWPDVAMGTRDLSLLEGFLCDRWMDPDPAEVLQPRPVYRWHICIALRDGERVYLNLLQSETARRSRITAGAGAKLGQESEEDGCMHLRDLDVTEISVSVDVVDTMRELVSGEVLPIGEGMPGMVLSTEDAQHLQGMMLTGWKTESDLLKGWVSQGVKKDQTPQGTRGREAGEQARAKNLQVKVGRRVTGFNVLCDESVLDTVNRYGAAAKIGLNA